MKNSDLPVITVTQLNRQIRLWLEQEVDEVLVEGELSNLSKPSSGHFYFTLKDASAQLRCVYFKQSAQYNKTTPLENGQHVLAQGRLSLYEPRGDYQLIVASIKEAGQGNLYLQFEALKTKLATLGLFDTARKKPLPRFPQTIGVITSPTGAALRDILSTLKRRFPLAAVIIYPTEVQGNEAATQLITAITTANQEQRAEVILLARGGGSIEDLWAFNNEMLAHAIAASRIPIVTGIGHETDTTIADFVSDWRAATPTAAAEAATPDRLDLLEKLNTFLAQLLHHIQRVLERKEWILRQTWHPRVSPQTRLNAHWQTIDFLKRHLEHAIQQAIAKYHAQLNQYHRTLDANNPLLLVQQAQARTNYLERLLHQHITTVLSLLKQRLIRALATLHAVSPLATLERGYSIVTHDNHVLSTSTEVNIGDNIKIRLAKGSLLAHILQKEVE